MSYIKSISELEHSSLSLAGGKGANLGVLIRGEFPVPPGFCITTDAYRAFVDANHLQQEIRKACEDLLIHDPAALETASTAIRARFAAGKVPADIADNIRNAYGHLNRQSAIDNQQSIAVAVRSSATAEDLPDMSFAGQQDTYLNIVGEEPLLQAVVNCWSSLWTARAIGYRARNEIPQDNVALAVIVQKMIPSEASGVLFTANPLTGKRSETVIDATFGLGEALVSGQVEPDHYVVDDGQIINKILGSKAVAIHGQSRGGTQMVTEDASARQALPDDIIAELAQMGKRIEQHFGAPQDIEWAWAGGQMTIVQSRPITSLYPLPARIRDNEFLVLFSVGAVQGMLDPFTPLGRDSFKRIVVAFSRIFGRQVTIDTQKGLFDAGERLFLNATPLFRHKYGHTFLNVYVAAIEPGARHAVETLCADPRLTLRKDRLKWSTLLGFWRLLSTVAVNVIISLIAPARRRARIQQTVDKLVDEVASRHAAAKTLADRLVVFEDIFTRMPSVFLRWLGPAVASGQAPLQILVRMCADLPDGPQTVWALTHGLPHNVTTEMDLALWDVAQVIKADPTSAQHLDQNDAAMLAAQYLDGLLPSTAQTILGNFMKSYGVRGVGEIDIGRPRWQDEPTALFQALRSYLQIDDEIRAPDVVFRRGEKSAEAAKDKLLTMLRDTPGGRVKTLLARFMIRRVRELGGLREYPKFAAIRLMTAQREGLLASGRDLVEKGVLIQPDDVFFLHLDELKALSAVKHCDWKTLVAEHRAAHDREKRRRRVPRVLLSDGIAFYEGMGAASQTDGIIIEGSPVSPGVVEGAVHVVLDPRGAQLAPGEILVCPGTDPAWTPLFLAAGGLVMEVGGLMTHGSVVAREYGIPAVVGVDQATTRLKTGQRIRVDGSKGEITLL